MRPPLLPTFTRRYFLGVAYLKSGMVGEAVSELEKAEADYGEDRMCGFPAIKVYYLLGQAYETSGWTKKAIEKYEKFLEIWKDADPGMEEIDDAKARVARLKRDTLCDHDRPAIQPVLQALWKLNPPVRPSMSRISPAKYNPGRIRLCIVLKSTSLRFTPPQVTNSSLNIPLPTMVKRPPVSSDWIASIAFRVRFVQVVSSATPLSRATRLQYLRGRETAGAVTTRLFPCCFLNAKSS